MDRYALRAAELAEELVASLNEHDVQALREDLSGATRDEWFAWCHTNASLVREFVRATPSQRRQAQWREHRAPLTYAAYLHCVHACAMLLAVAQHDLVPGGPYREMSARAGDAYRTATQLLNDYPGWPWSGRAPFR